MGSPKKMAGCVVSEFRADITVLCTEKLHCCVYVGLLMLASLWYLAISRRAAWIQFILEGQNSFDDW